MNLTKEIVYRLINEACKYMNANILNRPNTFAVISQYDQMEKQNLGFTPFDFREKKIWSRQYTTANQISLKYPYCILINTDIKGTNVGDSIVYSNEIDMQIIDLYIENKETQTNQERRTIEEIIKDNIKVMEQIFVYLRKVVPAKVETETNVFEIGYYNDDYLDYCYSNDLIESVTTVFTEYNNMKAMWNNFIGGSFNDMEFAKGNLDYLANSVSVSLIFKVPEHKCITANFDYSQNNSIFADTKLVYFGGDQKY